MILLVISLSIFYAWLNSAPGLDWVARSLASATGGIVELSGLTGRIPFHLTARQLVLRDSDHVEWLTARDITARTYLRALIQRELAIGKITVGTVEWQLFPHFRGAPDRTPGDGRYSRILPGPLKALRLDDAFIADFVITTNIILHEFRGSLKGNARWHGNDHVYAEATGPVLAGGVAPTVLDVIFKFEHGQLIFPRLNAGTRADADWFEGSAAYTIRNRALASTGELNVADAALYQTFHGLPLRGPAQFHLTANHERKGLPWEFIFNGTSEQLSFGVYTNSGMRLSGAIWLSRDSTGYELDYYADAAALTDWNFQQITVQASGTNTGFSVSLETAGQFKTNDAFTVASLHHISNEPSTDMWQIMTPRLEGAWNNRPVAITDPAIIRHDKDSTHFNLPSFAIAGGNGSASLQLERNVLNDARIELSDLASEEVAALFNVENSILQGGTRINAAIMATNLSRAARASATIEIRDIISRHPLMRPFHGSSINVDARLDESNVTASASFHHPLVQQFELVAQGYPARSGGFLPVTVDLERGIDARIQLRGELTPISRQLVESSATLGGAIELDLKASQLPRQPAFDGHFTLRDGEFRHITTGTYLDKINVGLSGKNNSLSIDHASARDGGSGILEAGGKVTFDDDWTPTWDAELDLARISLFRLIKSDLPLTGTIKSKGDAERAYVKGQVWLEPSAFLIPRRLPPGIRELPVREINHADPARNSPLEMPVRVATEKTEEPTGRPFDFDLTVQTRDKFEVKGRGLQSEWGGVVRLGGTSRAPTLTGTNAIKKGYAMLLGRRFTIDRGQIIFTGEVPPDPRLNIEASTRVSDVVVRIIVSGTTAKPKLTLASDPALPDEDIMSMILFGKSTETMSPWQAIALANGLRVLSGQGGDLVAVLDAGQNVLQLDQIDVKQDEKGEGFSSLSVGKYIGSRLYIEGEKGMGGSEDKFMMSYELSRRLVLETEASPRIREGIRLLWRREY